MSHWEFLVDQRDTSRTFGWLFLVAALAAAVCAYWEPVAITGAAVMGLLGMWSHSASVMLGKMADMQAALDMRRIALDHRPRGDRFFVNRGQELDLYGHCIVRLDRDAHMEIIR